MFTYIKLKNYCSLVDFQVNFMGKRDNPKKLILIYGENGVGKSNLATAFFTLYETLRTMSIKDMLEKLRESVSDEEFDDSSFQKFMKQNLKDIESIIKSSKTINSQDSMLLEFGFKLNGKKGVYRIETDNTHIISEHLDFVLNKNKTVFFDINETNVWINDKIFKSSDYKEDINILISKFWGKHSLLSLLVYEIEENKKGYVKARICNALFDVISYFMTMSIRVKAGYRVERGKMGISHEILGALDKGKISSLEIHELDKAETLLNEFFTRLYSDVKQVYYKKEFTDDEITYHLMFKKLIYNQLVDIDFDKESTGTQYLLEIIPFFMSCVEGQTAILDEMDTGIHDLLINTVLENLYDSIDGQIIMTTHNTMLLESDLPDECFYIFSVDENANKELLPLSAFEEHLHPNLNKRKRYLKGMYGGVPITMDADFNELMQMME